MSRLQELSDYEIEDYSDEEEDSQEQERDFWENWSRSNYFPNLYRCTCCWDRRIWEYEAYRVRISRFPVATNHLLEHIKQVYDKFDFKTSIYNQAQYSNNPDAWDQKVCQDCRQWILCFARKWKNLRK